MQIGKASSVDEIRSKLQRQAFWKNGFLKASTLPSFVFEMLLKS